MFMFGLDKGLPHEWKLIKKDHSWEELTGLPHIIDPEIRYRLANFAT